MSFGKLLADGICEDVIKLGLDKELGNALLHDQIIRFLYLKFRAKVPPKNS
jgi:hypothetical protein